MMIAGMVAAVSGLWCRVTVRCSGAREVITWRSDNVTKWWDDHRQAGIVRIVVVAGSSAGQAVF